MLSRFTFCHDTWSAPRDGRVLITGNMQDWAECSIRPVTRIRAAWLSVCIDLVGSFKALSTLHPSPRRRVSPHPTPAEA